MSGPVSASSTTDPGFGRAGKRLSPNRLLRPRAVAAATVGTAMEFYEFFAFAFFAPSIGAAFFPSQDASSSLFLTFATFGVSYLARPVGAAVLGAFGDRHGDRPVMILTVALMSLSGLVLALLPPAATIGVAAPVIVVAVRLVQGFAVGGEFGAATSLLLTSHPTRGGYYASQLQVSQTVGVTAAAAMGWGLGFVLHGAAYDLHAFRIAYGLGAVIGLIGLASRLRLIEPSPSRGEGASARPFRQLLARAPLRLVLAATMTAAGSAQAYTGAYLPSYAASVLHLRIDQGLGVFLMTSVILIPLTVIATRLTEPLPRLRVMTIVTVIELLAVLPLFMLLVARADPATLLFTQIALVAIMIGREVCVPAVLGGLFPLALRITGIAVGYTIGVVAFGAFLPAANVWLIARTGSPYSPAFVIMAMDVITLTSIALIARLPGSAASSATTAAGA